MGGHGGLNILPQKRWNVYNFDNREKVRQDEEAAAKEEQIKRDQSRKRDTQLRVLKLRQLRGLSTPEPKLKPTHEPHFDSVHAPEPKSIPEPKSDAEPVDSFKGESRHMNLFAGIKIFDPKQGGIDIEAKHEAKSEGKIDRRDSRAGKKMRKEKTEEVKVITAEDEKYRLGYGLVGKGSKLPWYLAKPPGSKEVESDGDGEREVVRKSSGKKSLEELREERLKRERKEKERERALFMQKSQRDRGFSSRR
ncbi:hypothetical protein Leryth_027106 [Lithospermum erythrorhizon]|nr:hypothetical protein Leryth_027106 [Lithospermum erythrorhizon]